MDEKREWTEDEENLADAMKELFSPEDVAVLARGVRKADPAAPDAKQRLAWFYRFLCDLVGGEEHVEAHPDGTQL